MKEYLVLNVYKMLIVLFVSTYTTLVIQLYGLNSGMDVQECDATKAY